MNTVPSAKRAFLAVRCLTLVSSVPVANAQDAKPTAPFPDAVASDPAKLGWMVGAPPPDDRILRFEDGSYFQFPALRWSVSNFRQLMPTVSASRGFGTPVALPRALRSDIDAVSFTPIEATKPMTWEESLAAN